MIKQARSRTRALLGHGAMACSTLAAAGLCHAAPTVDSYAVVSLVGDQLSIVTYQPATGSSLDKNITQSVPTTDGHFDKYAARVAINTIHRVTPEAASQVIEVPDEAAFGDAKSLLAADGTLPSLLTTVRPLLRQPDTHYLFVIDKYRSDTRLKTAHSSVGTGTVSGLGFYVDARKGMMSTKTGERGRGFVAPFAYVMVTLVDLRTGAVVASQEEVETATRANVGSQATFDPWDAMTAEQKVQMLDRLLGQAVHRAVLQIVDPEGSKEAPPA